LFRSVSRLTLIFTLALIVSGSILTYFSIINISYLKRLTEKKILEEQNELSDRVLDTIQKRIEDLTTEFEGAIISAKLGGEVLFDFWDSEHYCAFPFIIDSGGEFVYPNFVSKPYKGTLTENREVFIRNYLLGEKAEFNDKDLNAAKAYYLLCLNESMSCTDSTKSLNALGRSSIKDQDIESAIGFYSKVIVDYPSQLDENGYPYSYFAISQLTKIDDTSTEDSLLTLIEGWLKNMNNGSISMYNSTESLLDGISHGLDAWSIEDSSKIQYSRLLIKEIQDQLEYLYRYGTEIQWFVKEDPSLRSSIEVNGFEVLDCFWEDKNDLILINTNFDEPAGFVILGQQFFDFVLGNGINDGYEFDYLTEISQDNNWADKDKVLVYSSSMAPFFSISKLYIKLEKQDIVRDYVRERRWIYGMALTGLLMAMLLSIVLIVRDISHEKKMARVRSDLVSKVTHELKTPLTSIYMFAESILLNRVESESDRKEYLSLILKETERLKRLINNILEFAKMDQKKQKYRLMQTDLSLLMNSVLAEMKYWSEKRRITVVREIDPKIFVAVDPEKMKQVFGNLVSNAIKYTPESRSIFIRLTGDNNHIPVRLN